MFEIRDIADQADVIIDGYAMIQREDGRITIVNLNQEGHAAVFLPSGEVDETSMDEIELMIARKYLDRARKHLELKNA